MKTPAKIILSFSEREKKLFSPHSIFTPIPNVEFRWVDNTQMSAKEWQEALVQFQPNALVSCWSTARIPDEFLQSSPLLPQYLCHVSGSVRHIISRSFMERGGLVTTWGNMAAPMVAEHALLLILASLRKLPQWQPIMSSSGKEHDDQKDHMMTRSLYRKKVGIHGFGNVARTLFSLMKPFQVECFVYSKNVPHDFIREHGAIPCENLKELFSKSEILAECEALTPETEGSVTKEILHCLPHDAVFVNVGRGAVVDESALAQLALEEKIFVGSDVFCKEPLPHDSPFFKTRRALLSPHIAGPTLDSLPDCAKKAFENLKNFIDGKPLKNQLTLEGFDRAT